MINIFTSYRKIFAVIFLLLMDTFLFAEYKFIPQWSFLWTGFWEYEKNMQNRIDLKLDWQDITFRTQAIDKRPSIFWEELDIGDPAFSVGLYHKKTGSRLLYGILDEKGLSARLKKPWSRAVPFVENHIVSKVDLKTEPSSTKNPETYLYLGSPNIGIFKGFASVLLDNDINPAIVTGFDLQFSKKNKFHFEGFYTGKELPAHTPSTWFSASPPLPNRDFHLYALNASYSSTSLKLASDIAYSDTFGYGRDLYGNFGLRIGNRPWQISFAVDGAGRRFVGSDGSAVKSGFRFGGRFEYYKKRAELFRLATSLRASEFGESFQRSSSQIYYRFPYNFSGLLVRPTRISLNFGRNAENLQKIEDKAEINLGFILWNVRTMFTGTLIGSAHTDDQVVPFPFPEENRDFKSAKISGEFNYGFSIVYLRTKLGYSIRKDKDPVLDTTFSASIYWKKSRLGFTVSSPDFPEKWSYKLSWSFSHSN